MSTGWSAPDEQGISTRWVTRDDGVQTKWKSDPHGWISPSAPAARTSASDEQLAAAGYGDTARQHYIDHSGQDPEYAACTWDELIIPAAEAAGEIPETSHFDEAGRATMDALAEAGQIVWASNHHDPFDNSPAGQMAFRQYQQQVNQRAREILDAKGIEPAEYMLTETRIPAQDHDIDL